MVYLNLCNSYGDDKISMADPIRYATVENMLVSQRLEVVLFRPGTDPWLIINNNTQQLYLILIFLTFSGHNKIMLTILVVQLNLKLIVLRIADRFAERDGLKKNKWNNTVVDMVKGAFKAIFNRRNKICWSCF